VSIEERTKDSLGFERNVTAASGAVFLVGLGEEHEELVATFRDLRDAGCGILTISFLSALQAAVGQGAGVVVLAGLVALFFAPVLLFYFLANLAWRGQELRMIAQAMAQVAIRFSEPEGAASDSMVGQEPRLGADQR